MRVPSLKSWLALSSPEEKVLRDRLRHDYATATEAHSTRNAGDRGSRIQGRSAQPRGLNGKTKRIEFAILYLPIIASLAQITIESKAQSFTHLNESSIVN